MKDAQDNEGEKEKEGTSAMEALKDCMDFVFCAYKARDLFSPLHRIHS